MGRFAEYGSFDGLGLAELVRRGEISPAELVEEARQRMDRVDGRLGAIVRRLDGVARRQLEGRLPAGAPFRGVPFLLKDLVATLEGEVTAAGSRLFRELVAPHDSELVRRYRAAGLVFVAKTNTPELGLAPVTEPRLFGPSRNPWDPTRTPGGSSGGSAAAVAARIVPVAHGGDGGGSIRIPASCCGLFGLKPTRGRNPVGPDASERWNGFVQEHVVSRSVRDSAALLDATSGPEPASPYHAPAPPRPFLEEVDLDPGPLRIAFHSTPVMPARVHPESVAALRNAASLLEELGHHVEEVEPHHPQWEVARAFLMGVCGQTAAELVEAARLLGRPVTRAEVEPTTWLAAEVGRQLSAADYAVSLRTLQAEARRLVARYAEWDLVLTPTLASPPIRVGAHGPQGVEAALHELACRVRLGPLIARGPIFDMSVGRAFAFAPFTPLANFTGQPSASLPLYWTADGLPVGVMLTARFGQEGTLLRLSAQLERARPWVSRRPPVCADPD